MSNALNVITPEWDCPDNVIAYSSTRAGGVSMGDFSGLNVGAHVGDDLLFVKANRHQLPHNEKITWLEQVHGNKVVSLPSVDTTADAAVSSNRNFYCAIMTADCVPILLCDKDGTQVGAVHAGWKGLENNIIANAIRAFKCEPNNIMAWIGPAISQRCYEVDTSVASCFSTFDNVVKPSANQGKFLLDLPAIAQQQLQNSNVFSVTNSGLCTYSRQDLFYSHRFATHQNKKSTGRIVSVIGLS